MNPLQEKTSERQVIVIGGGPAGLTTAHELISKHDTKPIVFERLDKVGGISRTENYKNYYFDMGGHRFFTKSKEVNEFWHKILKNEFLRRPRMSRIYYNGRFFNYPIKPLNVLAGLGIFESIAIILSYLRWQILPYSEEESFEQWVTNRFGKRLFLTFFKTYTEKVWGISTSELKGEWAAQRIKNLSLRSAITSMFIKPQTKITTLIEEFEYPRRGPGMMWEAVKGQVEEAGGAVHLNSDVVAIHRDGDRITAIDVQQNGVMESFNGTDFVSSMPITTFIKYLDPPPPEHVLKAAQQLKYRDFLTVCLIVDNEDLFPDNWIYIHDPKVIVGRVQNFKNWSPDMVPDQSKSSLGLEYFCNEGDEIWTMADEDLIALAKRELAIIGLATYDEVEDGCVFRVPKSYPVYDSDYRDHLDVLRQYVDSLDNFQTIGRNGLHRYNNQDHAMLTGMLAVRNMVYGEENNLWVVNAEDEYHEEIYEDQEQQEPYDTETLTDAIAHVFAKLDSVAFGLATGAALGLTIFVVTLALVFKGGDVVGPHMGLLDNFFPGYSVTMAGGFLGLGYGFLGGFIIGALCSSIRNVTLFLYLAIVQRRFEMRALRGIIDYI